MSLDSEEFKPTTKNERLLMSAKTFLEITNGGPIITEKCRNGRKHDNNSIFGDITGEKLIVPLNKIAVIDIDINKKLDDIFEEDEADNIREDVKKKIDSMNDSLNIMVAQTTSGGFHIYCDGSEIRNNPIFDDKPSAHIHTFEYKIDCVDADNKPCDEVIFDIDLFVPTKNGKKCGVMLPGSLALNKRNNYGYYDIISYPNERTKKMSPIYEVFEELNNTFNVGYIDSIWKEKESTHPIIPKKSDNKITPELIDLIKFGFEGLTIHNYGEKIEKELSLFTIACALNSCLEYGIKEEVIDDFRNYLYNYSVLTPSADMNFDKIMYGTSEISDTPFALVKMIRIHNHEYYENSIKPVLYNKTGITSNMINDENKTNKINITRDLLDKIICGFKDIELSLDEMKSIIRELKSCERDLITNNTTLKYVGDITDNCKFNEKIDALQLLMDLKSMYRFPQCDKMIEILKEKNSQYFEKEISLLIKPIEYRIDLRDDFLLDNIIEKNYVVNGVLDKESLYNDIKRVYVRIVSQDRHFIKIYDGILNKYVLDVVNINGLRAIFDTVTIFKGVIDGSKKRITLFDIVTKEEDNNKFMKRGVSFNSKDENRFSLFQGFNYENFDEIDINKISLFLNHIKEIITSNDEKIYKYMMSWIAYLIQNPGKKTKTCLILIGKQGTGKTIFTDIIAKLFGEYANKNVSDVDLITGQFNTELENKILIVLNEFNVQDKTTNKRSIRNKMKSYITDDSITINRKNVTPYKIENVSNFIIVTNDNNPISIEVGDRRYVVLDVSDKMKNNVDYFNKLFASLTDDFYKNLFNYFRTYDIKDFDPSIIPNTERKNHIINSNRDSFEYYMDENRDKFYPNGRFTSKAAAYESYKIFCEREKMNYVYDGMKFKELLNEWCELKSQRDKDGGEPRKFYVLKSTYACDN